MGLFAEARYQPATPLTLTAGVRAERIQRDMLASNPDPYAPRPAFGVDVRESVNPRVSAAFLFGAGRAALEVAVGGSFACAVLDDQSVKCWGDNRSGQLGLEDQADRGDRPGEMGDALPALWLQ